MQRAILLILVSLVFGCVADAAMAAQGPGSGDGTATPLVQWLAVFCGIGLATLGVVFSAWDDGSGFES